MQLHSSCFGIPPKPKVGYCFSVIVKVHINLTKTLWRLFFYISISKRGHKGKHRALVCETQESNFPSCNTLQIRNSQIALRIPVSELCSFLIQSKGLVRLAFPPIYQSCIDHSHCWSIIRSLQEHLKSIVQIRLKTAAAVLELLAPSHVLHGLSHRPKRVAPRLADQRRRFEAPVAERGPDFGHQFLRKIGEIVAVRWGWCGDSIAVLREALVVELASLGVY